MRRSGLRHQVLLMAASSVILLTSSLALAPASAHGSHSVPSQTLKKATLACDGGQGLSVNAPRYVGLTVARATAMARASKSVSTSRIIAENGHCLRFTLDLKLDRVNFWVFQGHVIEARRF